MPGNRLEPIDLGRAELALLGCGDDGVGERVLALALGGRDEAQHVVFRDAVRSGDRDDLGLAPGERREVDEV